MAIAIRHFSGSYRFLSNFYHAKVELDGDVYPTVEHAFQAAKAPDKRDRRKIREAPSAARARQLGRRLKLRPNWEEMKMDIMWQLLESKFSSPRLARWLVGTYPRDLIEGNNWGDTYWGVDEVLGGQNVLGSLLMLVREGIMQGKPTRAIEARERKLAEIRAERKEKNLWYAEIRKNNPKLSPLPELPWKWDKTKGAAARGQAVAVPGRTKMVEVPPRMWGAWKETKKRKQPSKCARCGIHISATGDWTLWPWPDGKWLCNRCNEERHEGEDWIELERRERDDEGGGERG
jgi:ribA/ribD-fused uncharacterized protein